MSTSSQKHVFEYAKTGRAKCHGPCKGQYIEKGALRYGKKHSHAEYGEITLWMHWECSASALNRLASVRLDAVPGFRSLLPADQDRIRRDVNSRRIGPAAIHQPSSDGPSSSQTHGLSASTPFSSSSQASAGQKRRAEFAPSQTIAQAQSIDDESDEYFDNNQDEVKDELYISLAIKVVGLQYYKGMVGPGEEVTLVREPHNPHDRNAIQVLNISKMQVGHIPRNIASKLAPLIDRNLVTVEGVIHEGNLGKSEYAIAMTLKIYGASHRRPELEPLLVWATPRQRGFTDAMRPAGYQSNQPYTSTVDHSRGTQLPANHLAGPSGTHAGASITSSQRKAQEARLEAFRKAEELRSILNSLEKVNDEGRRASLLDVVCPTEDVLDLPLHPSPPSVASGELKVDLLRHQSQALLWCIERENPVLPQKESDRPVQFWQYKTAPGRHQGYYLNIATKTPQAAKPVLGKGGLMADAMGLGKTLTMLSLIIATKKDISEHFSNATLIVVPLSVLSNWKTQISDHFTSNSLTYHIYYETGRNLLSEQLKDYDIVITTYQVVAQDFAAKGNVVTKVDVNGNVKKKKKTKTGLLDVKWKRVILDEGHTIRNPKTKTAIAVRELEAERRWVVTGTPIINSPKDLGSILQFLRICSPLDNEDYYKRLLMRPLAQGAPEGPELLRALMSHICIRRTKEMQNSKGEPLISLPPVEMTLVPVQLEAATRELYDEVEALSQQRFATIMEHQSGSGRVNVLSLLTRLRQITLHPGLIPRNYVEQLRSMSADDSAKPLPAMPLTPADRIRLQAILARAIEDREECPICFDITNDPRITPCAHIYCFPCISEVISRDPKCPLDRRIINSSDLIEPPPVTDLTQAPPPMEHEDETEDFSLRGGSSAKIDQLVHLLQLTPKTEKSLVFSQFTGFLDKIAEALEGHQIPYVRFDGQMSARRRQEVMEKFSKPLVDSEIVTDVPLPVRRSRRVVVDSPDVNSNDDDFIADDQSDGDDSFVSEDEVPQTRKGKGRSLAKSKKTRPKSTQHFDNFDDDQNPVVMLISLKAGALGLNLTVANNVYLMDPWWQEGIESQAIDRCNRIGQTKPVHVYQLVAENTVEAKVLEIQERKKNLIKQAFSGVGPETQRQKKEARLQDLIELLGARRNNAT